MIHLSVNINKIATLRNSRGGHRPDPIVFAKRAIAAGVHGVTVHPRPDERHITLADTYAIAEVVPAHVEYNIEGYPDDRYLAMVKAIRPTQATLVPDPPGVLTSNAGWQADFHRERLQGICSQLREWGVRSSLFMETDKRHILAAKEVGADRIEFYTGPYAEAFAAHKGPESFAIYDACAAYAQSLGLGINAGHDLDLDNLVIFKNLTGLQEVSIGHALICDALDFGFEETIAKYLKAVYR